MDPTPGLQVAVVIAGIQPMSNSSRVCKASLHSLAISSQCSCSVTCYDKLNCIGSQTARSCSARSCTLFTQFMTDFVIHCPVPLLASSIFETTSLQSDSPTAKQRPPYWYCPFSMNIVNARLRFMGDAHSLCISSSVIPYTRHVNGLYRP